MQFKEWASSIPWRRWAYLLILIGFIIGSGLITRQSIETIGWYNAIFGFFAIGCGIASGVMYDDETKWAPISAIIILVIGAAFECFVHTEYFQQQDNIREVESDNYSKQRTQLLAKSGEAQHQAWSERPRSIGEIDADIAAILNTRIPRYRNTVSIVTKACTTNNQKIRAWRKCKEVFALRKERARALAMTINDKINEDTFEKAMKLETVPEPHQAVATIARLTSYSEEKAEDIWVIGRSLFIVFVIGALSHFTLAPILAAEILPPLNDPIPLTVNLETRQNLRLPKPSDAKLSTRDPFNRAERARPDIETWLSERTYQENDAHMGATEAFEDFNRYQALRGLPEFEQQVFGRVLTELTPDKSPYGKKRRTVYHGIGLLAEETQERNLSPSLSEGFRAVHKNLS